MALPRHRRIGRSAPHVETRAGGQPRSQRLRRVLAAVCAGSFVHAAAAAAADGAAPPQVHVRAPEVVPLPASEYYSTSPDAAVLVRVNIWGEVAKPGVYLLPLGVGVRDALSSAGGPTEAAVFPNIRLLRDAKLTYVDLLAAGGQAPVRENDMIYVDRSIKADLPLWLSVASVALSVATLLAVTKQAR